MENLKTNKTYFINPQDITVKEGFNARQVFDIEELAQQIKTYGLKMPMKVRPYTAEDGTTKYELKDGERRYRAIMSLIEQGDDYETTKLVEVQFDMCTDREQNLITQVLCNQGKPFTDYEYAIWYTKMCFDEEGNKIRNFTEAAALISKPRWHGALCSHILELSPENQEAFKDGRINLATLRRVVYALKGEMKSEDPNFTKEDLNKAVDEVLRITFKNNPEKKKFTTKDFDLSFRTNVQVDTINIRKGLLALKKYVDRLLKQGYTFNHNLTAGNILNELNKKEKENYIDKILDKFIVNKPDSITTNSKKVPALAE